MDLIGMMRVIVAELVGNRGAVRNCRDELHRVAENEAKVDRLSRRLPAASSSGTRFAFSA